jgi:hypothetical protein
MSRSRLRAGRGTASGPAEVAGAVGNAVRRMRDAAPTMTGAIDAAVRRGLLLALLLIGGLTLAPSAASAAGEPIARFTCSAPGVACTPCPVSCSDSTGATVPAGVRVGFDGRASSDDRPGAPAGTITAYAWSFGDGVTATGAQTGHAFAQTGTFSVTLKLTDNSAKTDTKVRTIVITKGQTVIATSASPGVALGGGTLSDSATVGGRGGSSAGATIDFRLYGPNDAACTAAPAFHPAPVAYPAAGGSVSSPAFTPTQAGTYRWTASYGGDANSLPSVSACNAPGETTTVVRAAASIASSASADLVLGAGALSDSATVAGRYRPSAGATVDFRLYGPDDPGCAGAPAFESLGVVVPAADGRVTSAPFAPALAGTYRWVASYGGDVANAPVSGWCGDPGQTTVVSAAAVLAIPALAAAPAAALDRDRDGVADIADGCPSFAGDRRNGCPSRVNAVIRGAWRVNDLFSKLVELTVKAPIGSRIDLRCSGAKGACPFKSRTILRTTQRMTGLTRSFSAMRILPADTRITIRVSHPLQRGTYKRLLTRAGRRLPAVVERCLDERRQVQRCP